MPEPSVIPGKALEQKLVLMQQEIRALQRHTRGDLVVTGVGGGTITIGPIPPADPAPGDIWIEED